MYFKKEQVECTFKDQAITIYLPSVSLADEGFNNDSRWCLGDLS